MGKALKSEQIRKYSMKLQYANRVIKTHSRRIQNAFRTHSEGVWNLERTLQKDNSVQKIYFEFHDAG
jgi:hypothetical protein